MQVLPVPGHISRLALSENNNFISWKNGLICVVDWSLERIGEWSLKKVIKFTKIGLSHKKC